MKLWAIPSVSYIRARAREIDAEELDDLTEKYVQAADRAIKAGFDGVEVHGAHSFLLNQFYSPLANKRRDAYSGSLENRIRFPLEVVNKVEKCIGKKLLLYRLGSVDLDPSGTQLTDSKHFAVKLEEAGVDIIDISGGFCGSRPKQLQKTQGFFIPQAQAVKNSVNIPVIGVGGIHDPSYANRLIRARGDVFLVFYNNDVPAGYFSVGTTNNTREGFLLQDTNTAQIKIAFIKPSFWRKGVGTALLNEALTWARDNGFERVFEEHETANYYGRKFWEKHFSSYLYFSIRYIDNTI